MNPLALILELEEPYPHLFEGIDENGNNWDKGFRISWADSSHKVVLDYIPKFQYVKPDVYTMRHFKNGVSLRQPRTAMTK